MNLVETALPEKLVSKADLARLFDVKLPTIALWIREGKVPKPLKIGKRPYWTPQAVARLLGQSDLADNGGSPLQAVTGSAKAARKGAKTR